MNISFEDKVVVITGAAGGIGQALVEGFARSGAKVAACDLRNAEENFSSLINEGLIIKGYNFDITEIEDVKAAVSEIVLDFGTIDVLINNAGINVGPEQRKTIDEFDDNWWKAIQNVDLNGVYNCSKAVINNMNRDGGSIVNISSVVGLVPLRNQCSFAAAKGAVVNLTKAMAIELADKKIRVNAVAPGTIGIAITNELWKNDDTMKALLAHIPQGRQGLPHEIANAVMFMASDAASYVTGTVLPVDGGWTAGGYARNF